MKISLQKSVNKSLIAFFMYLEVFYLQILYVFQMPMFVQQQHQPVGDGTPPRMLPGVVGIIENKENSYTADIPKDLDVSEVLGRDSGQSHTRTLVVSNKKICILQLQNSVKSLEKKTFTVEFNKEKTTTTRTSRVPCSSDDGQSGSEKRRQFYVEEAGSNPARPLSGFSKRMGGRSRVTTTTGSNGNSSGSGLPNRVNSVNSDTQNQAVLSPNNSSSIATTTTTNIRSSTKPCCFCWCCCCSCSW